MNIYQAKFQVRAAQITDIAALPDGAGLTLWFAETGEHIDVTTAWAERYKPEVGGWFVLYEDERASYIPDATFPLDFGKV